jgi:hypothetical protein
LNLGYVSFGIKYIFFRIFRVFGATEKCFWFDDKNLFNFHKMVSLFFFYKIIKYFLSLSFSFFNHWTTIGSCWSLSDHHQVCQTSTESCRSLWSIEESYRTTSKSRRSFSTVFIFHTSETPKNIFKKYISS